MITSRELRLIRALKHAIDNRDSRDVWCGVACPSCGVDYRSVTAFDPTPTNGSVRRSGSRKAAKASSAESILRLCLRRLSLTDKYRYGEITDYERIYLIREIAFYARGWFRHEADEFTRYHIHGKRVELGLAIPRSLQWIGADDGFMYQVEVDGPFRRHLGRFFKRCKQFVYEAILAATAALSGPAPIKEEDLSRVELEAVKQEQYFDKFESDVLGPGKSMTPKEFVARTEMYGSAPHQAAQRINRATSQAQQERRRLGEPKTRHCNDCPPLAAQGWVPSGTLPAIGETECNGMCLCWFEYRDGPQGKPYFITKQGEKLPAPHTPVMKSEDVEWVIDDDMKVYPIAGPP